MKEFCAFLRCFSGNREKRSGVDRQRLVAVNSGRLPGFHPRCARTSPDRTWSVGSARPRSRAIPPTPRPRGRLSVLAFCGVARGGSAAGDGPTTTAARAAALVSRACSPGESGVDGLAAAASPARASGVNAGVRAARRGGRPGRRERAAPGGARRAASGRAGFGVRRLVPASFRGFSQVDGRNGVYREEVEAEPSVAQLPDRVMRRRNAVAYMRSYVILNFSVLATAPPEPVPR